MHKVDIILLNGQVKVILFSLIINKENLLSIGISLFLMNYIWIHLLILSNGILIIKTKMNEKQPSGRILLF